jgi:hypothetical protein
MRTHEQQWLHMFLVDVFAKNSVNSLHNLNIQSIIPIF